ncbi:MAG TPA: alpha/beta fold hydrolase [Mycobacterium sp.]|jgi:predicted esterase|nr:alpha/beta fold hydrolase [Mycobacterium sp.]
MDTVEYAPGRLADRFGDPAAPTVLLWHGMQSNARSAVRTLAELVAAHGFSVVAADWDSHADDGGRDDLLRSARFAQDLGGGTDGLVVVGWSMGGLAAAGLTINAVGLDVRLKHTVCLAGAFMATDPITRDVPARSLAGAADRSPFTLLHGTDDDVVPIAASRDFADELSRHGWQVEVGELDADHATIAGAAYDKEADRYVAADDPQTLSVATDVAERIAAVCG